MMGLSFLTPAFFIGLVGLAVPIIIHLTNREKREVVAFPSLMFLTKIPYRSVRRQKIKHWLLFLMRCLAVVLLVTAFARPFLEQPGRAVASIGGARQVVILLDRSYSMGYGDRWARAIEAAHGAVDALAPEDQASLILFSDRAVVANQPTSDSVQLHALIDDARLGSGTTRYGPALQLADKLLRDLDLPRKEVVLITDFQRVGWDGHDEISFPSGTELRTVDLSDGETSNVSVTGVVLEREPVSGRERVVASARLTNKGAQVFEDIDVELELGGRPLREKTVRLEPNSSVTVTFDAFTLPEGVSRGVVRTSEDALPLDNTFQFVIWPGQSVSVLILEGPGAPSGRGLYLRQALAIGDRPRFGFDVKRSTELSRADLRGRAAVFLNDAPPPSNAAAQLLTEFVESGGGLVIVLGTEGDSSAWEGAAAGLLPAPAGVPVDRSTDWGGTLAYIDYGHPVFELFSSPGSGDFSPARFFRYRPLVTNGSVRNGKTLARFDDGSIALAERVLGDGRVLVWTSTLDTAWNDLALQPVYLPFVHQLVKYAAGYAEARPWHSVGEVLDLSRQLELTGSESGPGSAEVVVITPSGEKTFLSRQEDRQLVTLEEKGFYEIRYLESDAAGPLSLAANLDLTESDLSRLDPEEVKAAVSSRDTDGIQTAGVGTPVDQDRRQRVWWYLLVAALVLLAAETFWSNRLSRLAR
jgi:hypothetical protein